MYHRWVGRALLVAVASTLMVDSNAHECNECCCVASNLQIP